MVNKVMHATDGEGLFCEGCGTKVDIVIVLKVKDKPAIQLCRFCTWDAYLSINLAEQNQRLKDKKALYDTSHARSKC